MGGGFSQVGNQSPQLSDVFEILQTEKMSEEEIWKQVRLVPGIRDFRSAFSRTLCHTIAKVVTRHPDNIVNFLSVCVKYLTRISTNVPPDVDLYFVVMIASVATVAFSVLNMECFYVITFAKLEDVFYDLEQVLPRLMQAAGIGSSQSAHAWCQIQADLGVNETVRLHLLKLYLICLNIGKFRTQDCPPFDSVCVEDFPLDWFLISLCNECRACLSSIPKHDHSMKHVTLPQPDVVRSGIAVLAFMVLTEANVGDVIASCPCEKLQSAFFGGTDEKHAYSIIFNTSHYLAPELVTLFYLAVLHNQEFLNALPCPKYAVMAIVNSLQKGIEASSVGFVHRILLSILRIVLGRKDIAASLDVVEPYPLTCRFRPHRGTNMDVAVEILTHFAVYPDMIMPVAHLIQMISQNVKEYSLFTATSILKVFCSLSNVVKPGEQVKVARVFCETFASVVQARPVSNVNFAVVIAQHGNVFQRLSSQSATLAEPIGIILKFAKELTRITKEEARVQSISAEKAVEIVPRIDTEKLFREPISFSAPRHVFDGPMRQKWDEWCSELFMRCCSDEFNSLTHK